MDSANTSETTLTDWLFSERTQRWYPVIKGGAETDPDDTGDDTSDDTDDGTSDDTDDGSSGDEAKFTQKQVNAIAAREAKKAARGKLDPKELGFENGEELKTFLSEMKSRQEAEKTEAEKAQEQAIKDAKESTRAEVLSTANSRLIKAEFFVQAADAGIDKSALADAFLLAQNQEGWEEVTVSDDGVVGGITEEFFESFKEAKPFLFKQESDEEDDDDRDLGGGRGRSSGRGNDRDAELVQHFPALAGPAGGWREPPAR